METDFSEIAKLVEKQDLTGLKKLILDTKKNKLMRLEARKALSKIGTPEAKKVLETCIIALIETKKYKDMDRMEDIRKNNLIEELAKVGTKRATKYVIKSGKLASVANKASFALLDHEAKQEVISILLKDFLAEKPVISTALLDYCENLSYKSRKIVFQKLSEQYLHKNKITPKNPLFKYLIKYCNDEDFKWKSEVLSSIKGWNSLQASNFNIAEMLEYIDIKDHEVIETFRFLYQKAKFGEKVKNERNWIPFYLKFQLYDEKNPIIAHGNRSELEQYKKILENIGDKDKITLINEKLNSLD